MPLGPSSLAPAPRSTASFLPSTVPPSGHSVPVTGPCAGHTHPSLTAPSAFCAIPCQPGRGHCSPQLPLPLQTAPVSVPDSTSVQHRIWALLAALATSLDPELPEVKSGVIIGASLVAQWLRICLPMQGTRVRALVWEDPTCHGATGPVSHNY